MVEEPHDENLKTLRDTESEQGRSYQHLRDSLEALRRLYSSSPMLSADDIDIHDIEPRAMIQLANLAKLGAWIVDGGQEALSEADKYCLSSFQSQLSDQSSGVAELSLAIKTYRAVEALESKPSERSAEDAVQGTLMDGLEGRLREEHGGSELTPADQIFIAVVQSRKDGLISDAQNSSDLSKFQDDEVRSDVEVD